MNTIKNPKNILIVLLGVLLVAMPILSLDAGISGDEEVHMKQAESVIKYYSSFGKDRTALHTPYTNLKYYGQSFDNLTTLLGQWFNIEDIYTFRHVCNAFVGWLCVLFAALIAIFLSGYRTAIFTVLLLAVSPRFLGHSYNNLKDIPFALGYLASIFFILKITQDLRSVKLKYAVGLILSMAFILSVRPGGLLVFCYLGLFVLVKLFIEHKKNAFDKKTFFKLAQQVGLIVIAAYFIGLLFWPFALENPLVNPFVSMKMMSDYPVFLRQLFEGTMYWSDELPWYYLLKYVVITIPVIVLPMLALFFFYFRKNSNAEKLYQKSVLLFVVVFPFAFAILADSNVYGAWRHLLFVYPLLVVMASIGLNDFFLNVQSMYAKRVVFVLACIGLIPSTLFIIRNHPVEYAYFNKMAGNYQEVATRYEVDYYYHSVKKASDWLIDYVDENNLEDVQVVSNYSMGHYFRNLEDKISIEYTPYTLRGNKHWDYGIFYRAALAPTQTSTELWPPIGTVHTINIEDVPICAIVRRATNNDCLGKLEFEKGNYSKAIAHLEVAIQIDPGNEIAWVNLGKAYIEKGNLKKAKGALHKCLNILPDYEPCMYYLAQIEMQEGDYVAAELFYKQILEKNNKSYETYLAYAKMKRNMDEDSSAMVLLDKCLKLKPNYQPAIELRTKIMYNQI